MRAFVLQRPRGVIARGYRVAEEGDGVLTRHELPEGVNISLGESIYPFVREVQLFGSCLLAHQRRIVGSACALWCELKLRMGPPAVTDA